MRKGMEGLNVIVCSEVMGLVESAMKEVAEVKLKR